MHKSKVTKRNRAILQSIKLVQLAIDGDIPNEMKNIVVFGCTLGIENDWFWPENRLR